jgi:ABC-type sugar transport system substrate-binding protein
MAATRRIALFLTHMDETQQGWAELARARARDADGEIVEFWCEDDASRQNRQVSECIWKDLADALLVLPANLAGPAALLVQAVSRGKPVVLLDRTAMDMNADVAWGLPRLRREHPGTLVARVSPDEIEIGRIQARQARALIPKGGNVLYVQGDMRTAGAVARAQGFQEILADDSRFSVGRVDGGWSAGRAESAVFEWLHLVLIDTHFHLGLVVSQSEMMLPGVRAALTRIARDTGRPELASVPLTGCDGLPTFKREIASGLLAATIEVPPRTPPAIRMLAEFWKSGTLPPLEVHLQPASFPALDALAPAVGAVGPPA